MEAVFTPHMNFFLLETGRRSSAINSNSLCYFSLFFSSFETENVSRSDSSRLWIPIIRAQESCLVTKYLVDSSCKGWCKLSFWGINQCVRAVRHLLDCWGPLLGSLLQGKAENSAQVGSVWSSVQGHRSSPLWKGFGFIPRVLRVHCEKFHRSSKQGEAAKWARVPAPSSVSIGLPAPLGLRKHCQPPPSLLARVVPTAMFSLPFSACSLCCCFPCLSCLSLHSPIPRSFPTSHGFSCRVSPSCWSNPVETPLV